MATKLKRPLTISIHGEGLDIEAKIENDLQLATLLKKALMPIADATAEQAPSKRRN